MSLPLMGCGPSSPFQFNPLVNLPSLVGLYDFLDGSGTTLTDHSGSGNNGTLGIGASFRPTWNAGVGLTFSGNQLVQMPAGMCSSVIGTFSVFYLLDVAPGADVQTLLSPDSGDWPAINIDGTPAHASGDQQTPILKPSERQQGPLAFGFVFGASPKFFWGNRETKGYTVQSTPAQGAGGNLWLGYFPSVGHSYGATTPGNMYYLAVGSADWSAQMPALANYATAKVAARGVSVGNTLPASRNRIICVTDSLTIGKGATSPNGDYPAQLKATLVNPVAIYNCGVGGRTLATEVSRGPANIDTLWPLYSGTNVYAIWAGTNDLDGSIPPATVFSSLQSRVTTVLNAASNNRVIILTTLPRASSSGTFEADRQTYNASIRGASWGVKVAVADVGNDGTIGQAGQNTGVNYAADHIHLLNTGYAIVAGTYMLPALSTFGIT